jgi:hypothetical protein
VALQSQQHSGSSSELEQMNVGEVDLDDSRNINSSILVDLVRHLYFILKALEIKHLKEK